jgi:hypothetical protein
VERAKSRLEGVDWGASAAFFGGLWDRRCRRPDMRTWRSGGNPAGLLLLCCVVLCCVVLWSCCCDAYGGRVVWWAVCVGGQARVRQARQARQARAMASWPPVGRQLARPALGVVCTPTAHRPPPSARSLSALCTLHSALCALRWSGLCRACRLAIDSEMRCRLGVAMMASSSTVVSRAADYAATSAGTAEAQCKRSAAVFVVRAPLATSNGNGARHSRPSSTGSRPLAACFAARALTASRWASSRSVQGSSARLLQYYCRSTAGLQQRYCTTCRLLVESRGL